jgi:hypothetical protein
MTFSSVNSLLLLKPSSASGKLSQINDSNAYSEPPEQEVLFYTRIFFAFRKSVIDQPELDGYSGSER